MCYSARDMSKDFRVIAHRGASAHAPENTLPAFEKAVAMGAGEIELDVRFSSDEEIVVFHDDQLDQKTALQGRVRHYPAHILFRTDIGTWFDNRQTETRVRYAGTSITGLHPVLEQMKGRAHFHIELKGFEDLLPLRLLQMLDQFGLRSAVTITSFSMRPLLQMRRLAPEISLCLLLRGTVDAIRSAEFRPELVGSSPEQVQQYWINQAADAGFRQIGVRAAEMLPRTAAHAADRNLEVRGWGVRDESDLRRLYDLGAIGATVNWPGRALEAIHSRFRNR